MSLVDQKKLTAWDVPNPPNPVPVADVWPNVLVPEPNKLGCAVVVAPNNGWNINISLIYIKLWNNILNFINNQKKII